MSSLLFIIAQQAPQQESLFNAAPNGSDHCSILLFYDPSANETSERTSEIPFSPSKREIKLLQPAESMEKLMR